MPIAFYAAWFPETRALLISRSDSGASGLIGEQDAVDQLGPRASVERNQYWELPKDGVLGLPADAGARYTVYQDGDGAAVQLKLTERAGDETVMCVSYARDGGSTEDRQVRLLANPRKQWSDLGELHGHVRDVLRLGPQDHVQAIWLSPIADAGDRLHVAPARPVWPYGGQRCIEVRPLAKAIGTTTRIELTARADRLVAGSVKTPPISLSPMDDGSVVLLVWRTLFSGRLNAKSPNPFLREFHDNVQKYMGTSIAFDRNHSVPVAAKRPIARGRFFPHPQAGGPASPADVQSWQFDGPLDIHDILLLCVRSLPGRPVDLVHDDQTRQSSVIALEGLQLKILCWQADLDQLTPVAWDAIADEIRSALTAQLKRELQRHPIAADLAGDRPPPATADFETASHRALAAEAKAVAAAKRGSTIQHTDLFATDIDLSGVVEEWFATLPAAIVQRLRLNRRSERIAITNLARFLPVDATALLDDPGRWAVLEREAEELYQRIIDILGSLKSLTGPLAAHLRGDIRVWRSIGCADVLLPPDQAAEFHTIMESFAPNMAGSFAPLNPAIIKSASAILRKLERLIEEMSRKDEAASGAAEGAEPQA
ncbi:hypothetical protein [Bradyrhizobium liaoningense]